MTAPNQEYPAWMQLIGQGAFQVGGTGGGNDLPNFGQGVTTDAVTSIIQGPLQDLMNFDPASAVSDIVTLVSNYLNNMPLGGLQMFMGFIPGTTADDFKDVPTAVATIVNALGLNNTTLNLAAFDKWLTEVWDDLSEASTAFWTLLTSWSNDITAYAESGFADWDGFIAAIDADWLTYWNTVQALNADEATAFSTLLQAVFGIDPSTGMNAQWAALMGDLTALQALISSGDVSSADWAAWWIQTLEDLGVDSTDATNIGNWLSGNYQAAIDANAWVKRLLNDLTVILDLLHLTYQAGANTDAPGHLGTNGKPTWWSAVNDVLALFGLSAGTATPTLSGQTIGQTANNGITWITRLLTDCTVVFDWLHGTYEAGAPTDAPGHLGTNGKPTWWSAVNDVLALFGIVTSTTAGTISGQTVGQAVSAASTKAQNVTDAVVSASTGSTSTGNLASDAEAALAGVVNTLIGLSSTVQDLQTQQGALNQSGDAFGISFNSYANGSWPSTDFPVSYTGAGTSRLAISGGNAVMQAGTGGNVTAISHYKTATTTDYQTLKATIAGLPQGAAKTYACVRMNSAMDTYVYAGVYLSGWTLNWEIGCFVSGTQHVFATGSGAPLNFTFELKAGVGGNPYRFQGISGTQVVFDYTDSSHVSTVGSSNRYFGFKSITDNSGAYVPAPASYIGCFDDSPASVVGSGIVQYRSSTSAVTTATLNGVKFPAGFFDTTDKATPDLVPGTSTTLNAVTVANSGWYTMKIRAAISSVNMTSGNVSMDVCAFVNSTMVKAAGTPAYIANLATIQVFPSSIGGQIELYLNAGDVVEPGYLLEGGGVASTLQLTGDATGVRTYWSLVQSNRTP